MKKEEKNIKYIVEIMSKKFVSETRKKAYLEATKWVAVNVLGKDELKNVIIQYEKDNQSPSIVVHLFVGIDEQEIMSKHCNICKESHKSFYINDETNCNWCKVQAYQRRLENAIEAKRYVYKERVAGK